METDRLIYELDKLKRQHEKDVIYTGELNISVMLGDIIPKIKKLADYEDAEKQGNLVKVECHCKDCVHWSDKCAGCTDKAKLCTVGGYMVGENGYCLFAEQKLKEMESGNGKES